MVYLRLLQTQCYCFLCFENGIYVARKALAHMSMDHVHEHFGLHVHILSDRSTQFTGLFHQSLAERLGYT